LDKMNQPALGQDEPTPGQDEPTNPWTR